MVETITPVVHGPGKGYRIALALHAAGATVAAGLFGALLAGAGALLGAPWGAAGLIGLAGVALGYALREAGVVKLPVPARRRQVPSWWRTFYSPPVAALLYGLGLGIGFLTYLSYGTFVAVSAAAVASGDPLLGAALTGPFGLARALSLAGVNGRGRWDPGDVVARLEEWASTRVPRAANAVALAGICAAALAAL
jgi:hypothetical protein